MLGGFGGAVAGAMAGSAVLPGWGTFLGSVGGGVAGVFAGDKLGEVVKACVVIKEGSSLTDIELIDFCKEKIASYKKPRSVDFISEVPRNASGKVLKKTLREPYWKGRDRQVS